MDHKKECRQHTRKYLGVVFEIGYLKYFIPLSSPKDYDTRSDGTPRNSDIFCSRMIGKDKQGRDIVFGKLMYAYMIPVPDSVIVEYDVDSEMDIKYRDLVRNEYDWIQLRLGQIKDKALSFYGLMIAGIYNHDDIRYQNVVDFASVEKAYDDYLKTNKKKSS